MPVIKRYPNRKLYNTEEKKYVNLDGIADLIRQGNEVTIIDNESGEDITALTLTQIIYEQEKKQSGFLPNSILTGLIQASGDRINTIQRAVSASVSYWHQIDEEIRLRIQKLVNEGDLSEVEGIKLLDKLLNQDMLSTRKSLTEEQLQQALDDREIPTRKELEALMSQLDDLSIKLEEVQDSE